MSDLDPDEANYITENAQAMVGLNFGSESDPLYDSIDALSLQVWHTRSADRSQKTDWYVGN
jgi:hypothetical protein